MSHPQTDTPVPLAPSPVHLRGKTALITGASRGIGEAMAVAFVRSGARVVISSRKKDGIEASAERIRGICEGAEVHPIVAHAGESSANTELYAAAKEQLGQVDVIVNNAATNPYFGPLVSATSQKLWDKTFEVNLRGAFELSRMAAADWVSDGKPGAIVNVASVVASMGAPMQGIYAMTKAALVSMTQTLACELGSTGIRVNALAPGLIDTKLASAIVQSDELSARVIDRTPLGRVGQPHEVAHAALFLCSDAASFVTGHTLFVDGGMSISS